MCLPAATLPTLFPPFPLLGNGHGTHTAGTVGGRLVGVAPGASLLMSKILDDSGEGNTAVVLAAMEVVQTNFLARRTESGAERRPAVLSMSLGGSCDGSSSSSSNNAALICAHDPIVLAVERLSALGLVVSVAAGNARANACHGSPNAASSAVNVGATNRHDEVAYFSNVGEY